MVAIPPLRKLKHRSYSRWNSDFASKSSYPKLCIYIFVVLLLSMEVHSQLVTTRHLVRTKTISYCEPWKLFYASCS